MASHSAHSAYILRGRGGAIDYVTIQQFVQMAFKGKRVLRSAQQSLVRRRDSRAHLLVDIKTRTTLIRNKRILGTKRTKYT